MFVPLPCGLQLLSCLPLFDCDPPLADKYHGPEDAATRVLPAVGPLCVDAVHEVRASALACVQHFTRVLVEHNKVLEKQAAAMADSEGAAAGSRGSGAAPGASGGASLLNSFGWAVSNLGLGRGGPADTGKPAGGGAPAAAAAAAAGSAQAPAAAPAASAAAGRGGSAAPAAPAAAAAGNGWDNEDDGWDDMDSGNAGE